MATVENVFPGDSLPIVLETRKPDTGDYRTSEGIPITPIEAHFMVLDSQSPIEDTFMPLNEQGDLILPCEIEPQTGNTSRDRGGLVRFVVPSIVTMTPGSYKIYVPTNFGPGFGGVPIILTEDIVLKVRERR